MTSPAAPRPAAVEPDDGWEDPLADVFPGTQHAKLPRWASGEHPPGPGYRPVLLPAYGDPRWSTG